MVIFHGYVTNNQVVNQGVFMGKTAMSMNDFPAHGMELGTGAPIWRSQSRAPQIQRFTIVDRANINEICVGRTHSSIVEYYEL